MSRRRRFWAGFATGAAAGAGGTLGILLALNFVGRAGHRRVVHLEKSIEIASPLEDVFRAWHDLERLPQLSDVIEQVRRDGDHSRWRVNLEGRTYEWDAKIEQFIINQAIGWKSISGPKHSGRITFSPIGTNTMVHITMNYAPKVSLLTPFVASISQRLEDCIEKVLRDFKSSLEHQADSRPPVVRMPESDQATGTFGRDADVAGGTQHTRFGGTPNPVEFTRPPEAKS
ncbi:MAG TPA: SRPBCC family protein [Terriglobales bacterium]|nr:SRPBCC family protein [Terriglobales bacterium]